MNENLLILEGYDGSGKSTLAKEIAAALSSRGKRVRIMGRKNEPALIPISNLIENTVPPLLPESEILLRAALEFERLRLVEKASERFDMIILDRGPLSAKAWVRYFDLNPRVFSPAFVHIEQALKNSITVFCSCSFETCWARIQEKPQKSKKELLGKELNREWYDRYMCTVRSSRTVQRKIVVDTNEPIIRSLGVVLASVSALARSRNGL